MHSSEGVSGSSIEVDRYKYYRPLPINFESRVEKALDTSYPQFSFYIPISYSNLSTE